jgi:hypothetical protein
MEYPPQGQPFTYEAILKLHPHYGLDHNQILVIVSDPRRAVKIGERCDWFLHYWLLHRLLGNDLIPLDCLELTETPPEIKTYDQANLVYLLHILGFPIDKLRFRKSFHKLFNDFSLDLIVDTLCDMHVLDYDVDRLKLRGVIKDPDDFVDSAIWK